MRLLGLPCARASRLSSLFAQLVCWCVMCVVDLGGAPRRLHTNTHPYGRLAPPRPPIPPLSSLTTRAYHTHTRAHFTPQHLLLCHMGLYLFEFEFVVDVPRRHVSTWPALTCLTCRRCRAALFALRATATSDPFFRCAVVQQNEDSQPLITLSYTTAAASAVGVALVISKGRPLPFVARCSARFLASFLSRGLVLCLRRTGKAPVLCAAVCCVPSASALGSGRGGAVRP